jgi:ion channel-forming bestrophin family protein
VLAEIVKSARTRTAVTMRMEENLTTYEDVLGGCERILRAPIPVSYTRCA